MTLVSGLFSSCATPATSWPIAESFSACSSCAWVALSRSTVATSRLLAAASSSLICRIRRAFWISSGDVLGDLHDRRAVGRVEHRAGRDAEDPVARTRDLLVDAALAGGAPDGALRERAAAQPDLVAGQAAQRGDRPSEIARRARRCRAAGGRGDRTRAIASPIASKVASHSCLPARTKACSRAFCTPTATWFAMMPSSRSSSSVKRPGSGLPTLSTPMRSSPANIGTLSAERTGSARRTAGVERRRARRRCARARASRARRSLGRGTSGVALRPHPADRRPAR